MKQESNVTDTEDVDTRPLQHEPSEPGRSYACHTNGNNFRIAPQTTVQRIKSESKYNDPNVHKTRSKSRPLRRHPNFVSPERELLHKLVDPYKSVILSPKIDAHSSEMKTLVWGRVINEFNNAKLSAPRDRKQLQKCLYSMRNNPKYAFNASQPDECFRIRKILERELFSPSVSANRSSTPTQERNVAEDTKVVPKRIPNFTWSDYQLLHRLLQKHFKVLANEDNTKESNERKRVLWKKITKVFNKSSSIRRKTYELKALWRAYKRNWNHIKLPPSTTPTPIVCFDDDDVGNPVIPPKILSKEESLREEIVAEAESWILKDRVLSSPISSKHAKMANANVKFRRIKLAIEHNDSILQEKRDQERYDLQTKLSDQLFRQIYEQEKEIYQLTIANRHYEAPGPQQFS